MEKKVRKRGLALLLCLVMVASLLPVMGASAADAPSPVGTPGEQVNGDANDLKLEKKLLDNHDGTYSIELDGYANAMIVDEPIEEKIPTDFVVVVDQSGSMDTRDMPVGDPTVQNNKYLEDVANGAYYVKDGDNYYRVYGVKDYLYRYYPANYWFTGDIVDHLGADIGWFMSETDATTNIDNAFYFREEVGGQTYYIPIKTTIQGRIGTYYMRFSFPSKMTGSTYNFDREVTEYSSNGNSPWYHNVLNGEVINSGAFWAATNGAVQLLYRDDNAYTYSEVELPWPFSDIRTGMYVNYPMYGRYLSYTKLCYRDVNGVEHEVASDNDGRTVWEYCDDNGVARTTDSVTSARPTYSGLYTFSSTTDRVTALKAALGEFTQTIANETDDFGAVDNKIAIVGFSSSGYNNTELLTGENLTVRNNNGVQMGSATASDYATALVGATNGSLGTVNGKLTAAVNAITANGGTQPEDGLNMAYKVLTNRGDNTTYTIRSGDRAGETVDRNSVVIFFTDGQPGNYHYSNQYTEANDVVQAALPIKEYGASVFSIGVFGESDGNPLTYSDATRTNSQGEDKAWKYLGGWMESYHDPYSPYSWYCLRRQWRPNNAEGYTENPNDTIFDYMSVVSSNYPDAKNFIAPTWMTGGFSGNYIAATDGDEVRVKSTAEATNKYYRMASNQDTLIAAFMAAVTMNNSETTIHSNTSLGADGVLTDKVNTADFSVTPGSTVTAQVVDRTTGEVDDAATAALVYDPTVAPDGTVTVTGFDYSGTYNSKKLVVTITGLVPNTVGTLKSNDGNATITDNDDDVQAETTSPELVLDPSTSKTVKVLDFNMIANVDTNVANVNKNATSAPGGTFNWNAAGDDLTFTPRIVTTGNAWDTSAFSGVNQTMYLKDAAWKQAVVVPAASVYVADGLKTKGSDFDDGVSGFDAAVVETAPPVIQGENTKSSRTITFYGTGIDIYATTDDASGWISANLYAGTTIPDPASETDADGGTSYLGNQALKTQVVKNNSVDTHYGCPTIRFTVDTAGTYTVKINTSVGSNYKFEGVRIYRPADADAQAYQPESERAAFTRVRDILLSADTFNNAVVDGKNVSGAIFVEVKDAENQPEKTKTAVADTYRDNGPRGEVYLEPDQAIAFKVDTTGPVLIGMSSADGTPVNYAVTNVTEAERISTGTITSTVDMYYEAQPDANGYICIKNNGESGLLAITNVRARDAKTENGAVSFSVGQDVLDYVLQFEELLKSPWNFNADSVQKLCNEIWQLLLQSLQQLFSGLDKW